MNNEQIVFNKVPDGMPQDDTFKYEDIDVIEPSENELQLKTLYISV
ncbi:NADP-dependent oxidoreductase, partial [Staphylococcus epidermidis]